MTVGSLRSVLRAAARSSNCCLESGSAISAIVRPSALRLWKSIDGSGKRPAPKLNSVSCLGLGLNGFRLTPLVYAIAYGRAISLDRLTNCI